MTERIEVSAARIEEVARAALIAHGAGEMQAASVARAVRRAEETGNVICGLYYLESYCTQLQTGRVNGQAAPAVERLRPGVVRVDARLGFAQPAFDAGLDEALAAAREAGIALYLIAHSHTCTSLGYFTERLARAGVMALGATNASPIVAPPGGRKRVIGTNPIAFSVPDGQGGVALHFDFATSATALGRITMARAAGEAIPEGWAVDAQGNPTTDPEAALSGALLSAAGYKGWGIGLMVELLAAGLTGSNNSVNVPPLKAPEGPPHDLGQSYVLIDPAISPDFAARFATLAEAVAEDGGGRLPGARLAGADPVALPAALWAQALALAGRGSAQR